MVSLLAVALGAACGGLPPGGGHFVIVGRNEPPVESGLPPLHYAEADALNMRAVGQQLFCFSPDQITLLTGPEATADRLLATLSALTPKRPADRLGRLFVYVSSHGQAGGVLLDQALSATALFEAMGAVGARQTFSFFDACESAARAAKGGTSLATPWDEGHFHLTASAGRTYENHRLRGGEATQDFLSALYDLAGQAPSRVIRSLDICQHLHHHRHASLEGGCRQHFRGGEGIVLVPDRRPPGRLEVAVLAGSGPWLYLLTPVHEGRPVGGFPARTAFRDEAMGLPPGRWLVRRVHGKLQVCEAVQVEVRSGEVTYVREGDWGPDTDYCRAVERAERPAMGCPR